MALDTYESKIQRHMVINVCDFASVDYNVNGLLVNGSREIIYEIKH